VRLATFNILHGRSTRDGVVDIDRYASALRALNPDVLALQEVDRDQPRSHLADLTEVAAEAMGAVSHRFLAALSGTPGATWMAATGAEQPSGAAYGIALLSRYPVSAWQTVRLPSIPFSFPMWLPGPRKVIMVAEEPRVCLAATAQTPFGAMTFANTHLSFVPGLNRRQLRRLRRDLAPAAGPLVLLGDLNMSGSAPASITKYRALVHQATYPADRPLRQLDHVLVRGDVPEPVSVEVRELPLSDHRAVIVDF
jgi:endonuclease/exonuclease/phosphatase family metal-dependent hydrolase